MGAALAAIGHDQHLRGPTRRGILGRDPAALWQWCIGLHRGLEQATMGRVLPPPLGGGQAMGDMVGQQPAHGGTDQPADQGAGRIAPAQLPAQQRASNAARHGAHARGQSLVVPALAAGKQNARHGYTEQ